MIISLLAAALICHAGGQVNPPGTGVAPTQAAFYSVSGGTGTIEVRNSQGQLVPLVDTAGAFWPNATVALPAGTAVGLGWAVTQATPDGVHPLLPIGTAQYSLILRMNGNATESPVGTYDSSAGAGNGISLPDRFYANPVGCGEHLFDWIWIGDHECFAHERGREFERFLESKRVQ